MAIDEEQREQLNLCRIIHALNEDGTIRKTWHLQNTCSTAVMVSSSSTWPEHYTIMLDLTEEEARQSKLFIPPEPKFQLGTIMYYVGLAPIPGTKGETWEEREPHIYKIMITKASFDIQMGLYSWSYSFVTCDGEPKFEDSEELFFIRNEEDLKAVFRKPRKRSRDVCNNNLFCTHEEAEKRLREKIVAFRNENERRRK